MHCGRAGAGAAAAQEGALAAAGWRRQGGGGGKAAPVVVGLWARQPHLGIALNVQQQVSPREVLLALLQAATGMPDGSGSGQAATVAARPMFDAL
jgi:hypothetical protein